jgi:carboxylesterase type B
VLYVEKLLCLMTTAKITAFHSSELHFLFPIWREDGTPSDPAAFQQLQETMIGFWVNFVHNLNPNGDGRKPLL